MDINLKKSYERTLAVTVIVLVFMTILAIGLCYKLYSDNKSLVNALVNNKETIYLPMINSEEGFSFKGERGDARYLRLMAMSLVALRLDVTAQTVEQSHEILTAYLGEGLREKLVPILSQEKQRIKVNNGSSVFYLKTIKVSPSNGIVDVQGDLIFYYGIEKADPIPKHYRLRVETRNGRFELTDFVEIEK
ncbi:MULTISPECIES: TraE/TraK family type IV conjugative transfer system protein [unclassified Providencia]|uniref:TraE/TraK family type IV conjugative transfer system protein n=1 Tax=unclassified Providencia TaxID=2633465 RepID=UPI00234ABB98|nr:MULTISPECIES: TraE/TraK family type IV conjugative transfer system protein [unclassified Providencia]